MDDYKKFNIIIGVSISAFALYLLKRNNIIELKLIENKKDFSIQCNLSDENKDKSDKDKSKEFVDQNKNEELTNEIKSKEIDDEKNIKEDLDIIEKDEIKKYKKPFCLTNYIYKLYNH